MKAETIDVRQSSGRILSATIFRIGGRKLLAGGHILGKEDIRLLQSEGLAKISVAQLGEDEVDENEAVCGVAAEMACGSYQIRMEADGRANLIATEKSCVLVDVDLLRQVNCTSSLVIASTLNFSFAVTGQRVACVKSAPFAVSKADFEGTLNMLRQCGPIMQVRPVRNAAIAVLYCDPFNGDHARRLFESIVRQKLERFGIRSSHSLAVLETEEHVSCGLQRLLCSMPAAVLVASTTTPAGPGDVVGRAMTKINCVTERFLVPVEPGHLLLLGYKLDVPIMSAPGCFRSPRPNVVDVLLPPLLARYRVSNWELACLGHGGLLNETRSVTA